MTDEAESSDTKAKELKKQLENDERASKEECSRLEEKLKELSTETEALTSAKDEAINR